MTTRVYKILKHDGGWAYEANDTYSESFKSHDEARAAATLAAKEQGVAGETVTISYEDEAGHWHSEVSPGNDRPITDVEG